MRPPPGIVWLTRNSPKLFIPPVLAYAALSRSAHAGWVCALGSFLSLPLFAILRSLYTDFIIWRGARAIGAVLPPTAADRTLGLGLGIIKSLVGDIERGYLGDTFDELTKECGTIVHFKMMLENRIFTTDPEYIKALLATQFDQFEKGPFTSARISSLLGQGVFNADGDIWKFHRSMTRPFFAKEKVRHFEVFERHAEDALQQIRARIRQGYPIDFQDMISRFTLDSATEFLFGQDVCSLSAGLVYPEDAEHDASTTASNSHPANIFARSFNRAQELIAIRSRRGVTWPLAELFEDKVYKHRKVVERFVDPLIAEALKKKSELGDEKAEDREDETLLDHLVRCTEDQGIIRDEVLNIMVAGRDTTATTLTFMTYMLAEHPPVLKKLRQEILEKVGPSQKPTFEDIKEMKYLRAVINETLRLYTAVPLNARTSRTATTFHPKTPGAKPWYIPAGIQVFYSIFLMHRRKDLWGPDADEFDPERFLDDRIQYLIKNPFIFLPFSAGPRICLGQQFAYNEVSYFAIRFLQTFSDVIFEKASILPPSEWVGLPGRKGRDRIWPQMHLTIFVRGNIWFRLKEAQETDECED